MVRFCVRFAAWPRFAHGIAMLILAGLLFAVLVAAKPTAVRG